MKGINPIINRLRYLCNTSMTYYNQEDTKPLANIIHSILKDDFCMLISAMYHVVFYQIFSVLEGFVPVYYIWLLSPLSAPILHKFAV